MDYFTKLIENQLSLQRKAELLPEYREDYHYRIFKPIHMKEDIYLSIQAGAYHFSDPRKTIALDQYNAMEIAIIKEGKMVDVREVTNDEILILYFDFFKRGDIYRYVPLISINQLYQALKE